MLWPFGNVVVIWYIFPRFGILCQEKSGNPAPARGNLQAHSPKECTRQPPAPQIRK
jgi:hypothetical protein